MALITTTEAKQQIPALSGTADDALLTELISVAGAVIAKYLGYPPASVGGTPTAESTSYTRYLDGPGGRILTTDVYPLTAVTSVYDDPAWDYSASYLVSSSDYSIVEGDKGLIVLSSTSAHGTWTTGKRAIKATFTAGYATVPDWLQQAARITVRALYDGRNSQGKENKSEGGVNVSFVKPAALPIEAKQILAPYRLARTMEVS